MENRNLPLTLPITPWEAVLGAQITIPIIGGKVNLTIPKGATSGQKLRLKGKGLPGKVAGDQIVTLKIDIPAQHSATAE